MSYLDYNAESLWLQSQRALDDVRGVSSGLSMISQDVARPSEEVEYGAERLRRAERAIADLRKTFEEELDSSNNP